MKPSKRLRSYIEKVKKEIMRQAITEAGEPARWIFLDPKLKALADGPDSAANDAAIDEYVAKLPSEQQAAFTNLLDRAEQLAKERGVSFD